MTPQQMIAHYKITSKLGEGGMGAVYRATDTKLNREVAIKILPPAFAEDTGRLARFEREAQVLASLNHPNIAAIYGIEQGALVMELVEGEDLHGPLPLDTTLDYARQIAAALEAAHEKGIVHRDLKPANIKVTPDGKVKLLDFGLAKASETMASGTGPSPTLSPTLSLAMTQAGMILGTAAYMSPEQARGKAVDKRADIWAFGVVLYEMLTGGMLYGGETVSDSMAAVITREPDWSALPANTPPHIRRLLERCLRKDPLTRMRDIGEARIALNAPPVSAEPTPATKPARARRTILPWAIVAATALAAVAFAALWLRRPVEEARAIRFAIAPPDKAVFNSNGMPLVSPDGRRIVFTAGVDGKNQLWVRDLDAMTARALPGTEGVTNTAFPFWSPDSRSLGFFVGGKLRRLDVLGGPALPLCDAPNPRGGTWSRKDVIVFNGSNGAPLMRVAAAGGTPVPATEFDASRHESGHRWPHFLPDERHFLYLARSGGAGGNATVWLGDLESKARRHVLDGASNAVYDPRGFVLFVRENTLMAQPFDAGRLETAGDPFAVAEQVDYTPNNALGHFSLSQNGVLAYTTGGRTGRFQFTWFDRTGKPLGTLGPPGLMLGCSISPDGSKVAVDRVGQNGATDIWLHDLAHGTDSRFTFGPGNNSYPVWSPDGSRVAFLSIRNGPYGLYVKPSSGTGQEELLYESPDAKLGPNWSRDGKFLFFSAISPKTAYDIWVLANPLGDAAARKPYAFLQTAAQESAPALSPDGKYLAYHSDESNTFQVYAQSFPGKEGKFQISSSGGTRPVWSRDGKELYYIAADQKMMEVDVKTGAGFEHGIPRPLFDTRTIVNSRFDVSPDGKRFLLVNAGGDTGNTSMVVVVNWLAGVRK